MQYREEKFRQTSETTNSFLKKNRATRLFLAFLTKTLIQFFIFFFAVSRGKISSNKRKHQFQSPLVVTWTNLYSPGHGSLANEAFEVIFWGKKTSLKFDLPSWSVWLRKIRIFTFLKERKKNQLGEDVFDFIYLQLQEDFSNILII